MCQRVAYGTLNVNGEWYLVELFNQEMGGVSNADDSGRTDVGSNVSGSGWSAADDGGVVRGADGYLASFFGGGGSGERRSAGAGDGHTGDEYPGDACSSANSGAGQGDWLRALAQGIMNDCDPELDVYGDCPF